jgi:hypothetical protein
MGAFGVTGVMLESAAVLGRATSGSTRLLALTGAGVVADA